jgi:hypothetical protein
MAGSVLARAQEVSGSISGTVVDGKGAAVSGAVVTLTDMDQAHAARILKTDKAGFYSAPRLLIGNYTVAIIANGFKTVSITGIVINANDVLKLDQKLEAGSASETVAVAAAPLPVNLGDGTSKSLVTGTQVRELPLVTRNYESLVTLQPGVSEGGTTEQYYPGSSLPSGTTNLAPFSINGRPPSENEWTVDGADNVNHGNANPALPLGGYSLLTVPSVDAISEVETLRGTYEAEYGRNASGQINVATLSGTNAFHGGAYEFFRNNLFNANNYFNNLAGVTRPVLRYNDFGFKVGGPVIIPHFYNGTNKTFFFYSQEFRRVVNYATSTTQVPTAAEEAGTFSSGAVCAPGGFLATGVCNTYTNSYTASQLAGLLTVNGTEQAQAAYLKDIFANPNIPAPNPAAGQTANTLTSNVRNTFNDAQEFARIDENLGHKINAFYHYQHDNLPTTEGNGLFQTAGGIPGVQNTSTTSPATSQIGHMTIAVHPNFLVDLGYAYSSSAIHSVPTGLASTSVDTATALAFGKTCGTAGTPQQCASVGASTTLPYIHTTGSVIGSTLGIVPSLTFAGVSGSATPTGISNIGIYNQLSVNHNGFGDVTKIIRQQTLKFGVSYNHYQLKENATGNASPYPQGSFTFNPSTPTAAQLGALGAGSVAANPFESEFANFLLGNANGGFTQGAQVITPSINENLAEAYLQDDWRATRRLTLNLGVRYSFFGQPFDDSKELSNFDPATYNPSYAETVDSNGNLCTVAGQTTITQASGSSGITNTYTLHNCANANGLSLYQPNPIADPINGIILGDPTYAYVQNLPFNSSGIGSSGLPGVQNPNGNCPETLYCETQFGLATNASPYGQVVGHAEKHDFAPRIGFALDVFGNGKTALRGGYGIAYDASSVSAYEQEVFNNPPYNYTKDYPAATLSAPNCPNVYFLCSSLSGSVSASGPTLNYLTPPSLYATPVIYKTPYVQQFSLDVQQEITPTLILDVGYFGNHGDHLLGRVDINEPYPGSFAQASTTNSASETINYTQVPGCGGFTTLACETPLNQIRPYVGYTAINQVQTVFNSSYNGLQAKVTKKFSGNSMIDANYTFSRALTNVPGDLNTAAQNSYNLAQNYGPSALNRNDILTIDGIWDLPWFRDQKGAEGLILGGWEVSGIYEINSGQPLTVTMPTAGTVQYAGVTSAYNASLTNGGVINDAAGLGIAPGSTSLAVLRPNVVLNPNNGYGMVNLKNRLNWFNQTAFIAPSPASYQVGNERSGIITGPGSNRLDVGLFRTFKIYHSVSFQVRGEAYNVLNHTNWGQISTNAASPQFGQAITANDPRILQVAGKINF